MSYDNPNAMPDDPSRTADYGYFPWESEAERPRVSRNEAVLRVIDVLANREKRAFGDNDDGWEEMLASGYLVEKYRPLLIALLQHDETTLCEIGQYLRECIAGQANEWMAEADNDELEREGFV